MFTNCSVSIFQNSLRRTSRTMIVWLLLAASVHLCCKETPPEPPKPATISLKAEDASCTEAWLKATTTEIPVTVRLLRDGQRTSDFRLLTSDSLLHDEGLLPRRTYAYQLQKLAADSSVAETSASLQLTTMDTTSHNFTWQIDTLGVTSSVLYDVAIINDTLAYAVGEMYLRDSTGQIDPQAWNAAKWNGQRWELKRIPFIGPCSAVLYPSLKAIWIFSANNMLVTNGGSIVRYDGVSATMDCGMNSLLAGAINKIYAVSPQDVYIVGNAGTIAHYNGSTWQRVASGTSSDVQNISGYIPPSQGSRVILSAASSPAETKILSLSPGGTHDTLSWAPAQRLRGIWVGSKFVVYVSGPGIWRHSDSGWRQMSGTPQNVFLTGVRGTSGNNIFTAAWRGVLAHFSGVSWHQYTEIPADFNFEAVTVSQNMVVAVGFTGGLFADRAAIIIGRRIQ